MTSYQPFIPFNIWRHVRTRFVIESLTLSKDCFNLRPSEKNISFVHSSKMPIKDQLKDVHHNLLKKLKRNIPCYYLSLDKDRALVDINEFETRTCIKFCDERYPHISLYYEQSLSSFEILEIKTTLVELSDLFIVKYNNNQLEYKGVGE